MADRPYAFALERSSIDFAGCSAVFPRSEEHENNTSRDHATFPILVSDPRVENQPNMRKMLHTGRHPKVEKSKICRQNVASSASTEVPELSTPIDSKIGPRRPTSVGGPKSDLPSFPAE